MPSDINPPVHRSARRQHRKSFQLNTITAALKNGIPYNAVIQRSIDVLLPNIAHTGCLKMTPYAVFPKFL